jgi:hypothetical protein
MFFALLSTESAVAATFSGDSATSTSNSITYFKVFNPTTAMIFAIIGAAIMNYPGLVEFMTDPKARFKFILELKLPVFWKALAIILFTLFVGVYSMAYAASAYMGCMGSVIGTAVTSAGGDSAGIGVCVTGSLVNGVANALTCVLLTSNFLELTLPRAASLNRRTLCSPMLGISVILALWFFLSHAAIFNTAEAGIKKIPALSPAAFPFAFTTAFARTIFSLDMVLFNPQKRQMLITRLEPLWRPIKMLLTSCQTRKLPDRTIEGINRQPLLSAEAVRLDVDMPLASEAAEVSMPSQAILNSGSIEDNWRIASKFVFSLVAIVGMSLCYSLTQVPAMHKTERSFMHVDTAGGAISLLVIGFAAMLIFNINLITLGINLLLQPLPKKPPVIAMSSVTGYAPSSVGLPGSLALARQLSVANGKRAAAIADAAAGR